MKKALFLLFVVSSVLSGCKDNLDSIYDPDYVRSHNDFNFSTVTSTTVNVSYANTCLGNKIYFEIYSEDPLVSNNGATPTLNSELSPIYSGYTDSSGNFTAKINLPSYLASKTDVYVYSPYFYVPTLLKCTTSTGSLTADDSEYSTNALEKVRSRIQTRAGSDNSALYFTTAVDANDYGDGLSSDKWLQKLGEYNQTTGEITGFFEPGSTAYTTENKRVSTDDYSLLESWSWWGYSSSYYYYDPDGIIHYVEDFYNANGQLSSKTYPTRSFKYYDRIILVSSTKEPIWHNGYNYTYVEGDGTSDLSLSTDEAANLYAAHTSVININTSCPTDYRASHDMYIGEDNTEVVITYLGGNTCWNSSLGYYYYYGNDKPTSYSDLINNYHVILIFPNTQDGHWRTASAGYMGTDRGTAVQLKFYGYDMKGEGTTEFPSGCRIGFVLATNAWNNRIDGYTSTSKYRAATTEGVSLNTSGTAFLVGGEGKGDPRRAAIYKDAGNNVVVSFEDRQDDQNYSDVVFAIKSSKEITDIPVIKGGITTHSETKGVYAFEDMWPQAGDYDMNDVVIRYNYIRTLFTKIVSGVAQGTTLVKETFQFKTFQNYATLINGLAFKVSQYADQSGIQKIIYEKQYPDTEEAKALSDYSTYETMHEYTNPLMDPTRTDITYNYSTVYKNWSKSAPDAYLITDNIANKANQQGVVGFAPDPIGTTYQVSFVYNTKYDDTTVDADARAGISTDYRTEICPFVTRVHDATYDRTGGEMDYRLEIHIPYEAPTQSSGMLDQTENSWPYIALWNHYDDASNPFAETGEITYYLRANDVTYTNTGEAITLRGASAYPFAFFLSGFGTDLQLSKMKLLNPKYETVPISDVYSLYMNWVEDKTNSAYAGWYLEEE